MEQSPRKFLNKLSVSHSSAQNATKWLKLWPYKIPEVPAFKS
jgi:hypothetical protein